MQIRHFALVILGIVTLWFLYSVGSILTPFILAAIFAYILNPVISALSERTKTERVFYVTLLYVGLFVVIGWGGTFLTKQAFFEAQELSRETEVFLRQTDSQIGNLPIWAQDFARSAIISIRDATNIEPTAILPFFSGAASRILATITFLFASFYFLKDGRRIVDGLLLLLPGERKLEVEILLRRINAVLGDYLRGQLLIVLLMGTLGFIMFTLLGVRFSLLLGIVIGLAEIIPMIGPIIAGAVAIIFAAFDGASKFGLPPVYDGLVVLAAYVILNQIENYLIVPQIMGKVTKLHPLLIFFSVLAGGHLFGILGFILAVPVAAILRIFLEYLLDKLAST